MATHSADVHTTFLIPDSIPHVVSLVETLDIPPPPPPPPPPSSLNHNHMQIIDPFTYFAYDYHINSYIMKTVQIWLKIWFVQMLGKASIILKDMAIIFNVVGIWEYW